MIAPFSDCKVWLVWTPDPNGLLPETFTSQGRAVNEALSLHFQFGCSGFSKHIIYHTCSLFIWLYFVNFHERYGNRKIEHDYVFRFYTALTFWHCIIAHGAILCNGMWQYLHRLLRRRTSHMSRMIESFAIHCQNREQKYSWFAKEANIMNTTYIIY